MRSFAEWMSFVATSVSIAFTGKKPYATVPYASRRKWLSVNPGQAMGPSAAPGSSSWTYESSASQSGVSIGDRVPPTASSHSIS